MAADNAPATDFRSAWRRARAAFAALLLCAASVAAAQEREAGDERELQVEAAFLVNFVRYTDWPPGRFASPGAPYVAIVVGSERDAALVAAVAGAAGAIDGRRIAVRRADPAEVRRQAGGRALQGGHLVFVRADAGVSCERVRRLLDGAPVLTVGDAPGCAAEGGMLGLVRVERHLAFEANPSAIRAAGLAVSAKVLKLARLRGDAP